MYFNGSLTRVAFTLYSSIGGLTLLNQFGNLIKLAAYDVEHLFCCLNLDKAKPQPLKMTENQEFIASIYAKFFSGFHGNHQLPSGPKHSSAKASAYYTHIPLFHSHLLHKQSQYSMIFLTILSNGKPAQKWNGPMNQAWPGTRPAATSGCGARLLPACLRCPARPTPLGGRS